MLVNSERFNSIGENVFISSRAEFKRPHLVDVGSNVAVDSGFYGTTKLRIGNYVHIAPYVTIIGGSDAECVIEDFVGIAAGSRIICLGDEHLGAGLVGPLIPDEFRDNTLGGFTRIGKFAGLGTNSVIMPGVNIAEGSVVGAGSVIYKDTQPWTIYAGNPSKAVRARDSESMINYGHQLS